MDFFESCRLAGRRWSWILLGAVLGLAAGVGLFAASEKTYQAETTVSFQKVAEDEANVVGQRAASRFVLQRMPSYRELARSERVTSAAARTLGLDDPPSEVARRITPTAQPLAFVLTISATGPDALSAARLADATARALAAEVESIEREGPGAVPVVNATVITRAVVPDAPSSSVWPYAVAGAFFGALAAFGLAALVELRRALRRPSGRTTQEPVPTGGAS